VVGFGNCDAASALMLNAGGGCDALVLANPWTIEQGRRRPAPRRDPRPLRREAENPKELVRLATGKVSLKKLAGGLKRAVARAPPPTSLAQEMKAGLAHFAGPCACLSLSATAPARPSRRVGRGRAHRALPRRQPRLRRARRARLAVRPPG
jgi:hypothetical protein